MIERTEKMAEANKVTNTNDYELNSQMLAVDYTLGIYDGSVQIKNPNTEYIHYTRNHHQQNASWCYLCATEILEWWWISQVVFNLSSFITFCVFGL